MQTDDEIIAELEIHNETMGKLTLAEAMEKYDVVSANYDPVHGSYIVMAERDPKMSTDLAIRELGYSSPSPFTSWTREERVSELRDKAGIRTYYDMKRADGTVRGALRLLKTPVMAARWFVEPASDAAIDRNIGLFIEDCLFNKLNAPWHRVLEDALLMCEYGYVALEKVYTQDQDGRIILKKLAPRHPLDIKEWLYDDEGGPDGIVMEATEANGWKDIPIPIEKLVVFVLEQEAGDMRGISILRSAYKHYYYKDTFYKIDAIQKERHGIGVPIIKMPLGYSKEDKQLAEDLGRNLRTNERAHVTVPMNWEICFAELKGQPVDCLTSIAHHDRKIYDNILAGFATDTDAKEDVMTMFYKATRYIASTVADTLNRYVVKQLVDFNFSRGGYPKIKVRRIGEWEDLRTLSFAIRNFVGAGIISPDEKLEDFIRSEADLPPAEHETRRTLNQTGSNSATGSDVAPPKPPKVGMPRQKKTPPIGTPQMNAGTDRSGG